MGDVENAKSLHNFYIMCWLVGVRDTLCCIFSYVKIEIKGVFSIVSMVLVFICLFAR